MSPLTSLLSPDKETVIRSILSDRLISVCFGAGVDSTAMLALLVHLGIKTGAITFADTGGERDKT